MATIDRYGHFQITDRSKDVIKSGGEWVSSIEVEGVIMSHPAVHPPQSHTLHAHTCSPTGRMAPKDINLKFLTQLGLASCVCPGINSAHSASDNPAACQCNKFPTESA